jgi:hypothetical protein
MQFTQVINRLGLIFMKGNRKQQRTGKLSRFQGAVLPPIQKNMALQLICLFFSAFPVPLVQEVINCRICYYLEKTYSYNCSSDICKQVE